MSAKKVDPNAGTEASGTTVVPNSRTTFGINCSRGLSNDGLVSWKASGLDSDQPRLEYNCSFQTLNVNTSLSFIREELRLRARPTY